MDEVKKKVTHEEMIDEKRNVDSPESYCKNNNEDPITMEPFDHVNDDIVLIFPNNKFVKGQAMCYRRDDLIKMMAKSEVTTWQMKEGIEEGVWDPQGKKVFRLNDGQWVVNGEILQGDQSIKTLIQPGLPISVCYSPNGKYIASGSNDQKIRIWEIAIRLNIAILSGHSGMIYSVCYSPDGKYLASGSGDKTIRIWDIESEKTVSILSDHSDWVTSVCYSPDGKYLASGSADKIIRIWETASGKSVSALLGHSGWVWSVCYSPEGKYLASGSEDRTIRIWETARGKTMSILSGHSGSVLSVCYSPDGKYVASGSGDKTIRIWEIASMKTVSILSGHFEKVNSVCYSPNGKYVASGSRDKTIRIWDVASGKSIEVLTGHTGDIYSVCYSPDGKYLASGSADKTIRIWNINTVRQKTFYLDNPQSIPIGSHFGESRLHGTPQTVYTLRIADTNAIGLADYYKPEHLQLLKHQQQESKSEEEQESKQEEEIQQFYPALKVSLQGISELLIDHVNNNDISAIKQTLQSQDSTNQRILRSILLEMAVENKKKDIVDFLLSQGKIDYAFALIKIMMKNDPEMLGQLCSLQSYKDKLWDGSVYYKSQKKEGQTIDFQQELIIILLQNYPVKDLYPMINQMIECGVTSSLILYTLSKYFLTQKELGGNAKKKLIPLAEMMKWLIKEKKAVPNMAITKGDRALIHVLTGKPIEEIDFSLAPIIISQNEDSDYELDPEDIYEMSSSGPG